MQLKLHCGFIRLHLGTAGPARAGVSGRTSHTLIGAFAADHDCAGCVSCKGEDIANFRVSTGSHLRAGHVASRSGRCSRARVLGHTHPLLLRFLHSTSRAAGSRPRFSLLTFTAQLGSMKQCAASHPPRRALPTVTEAQGPPRWDSGGGGTPTLQRLTLQGLAHEKLMTSIRVAVYLSARP